MPLVELGKKAPAFNLRISTGKPIAPPSFLGRPLVLYFYPKDDTPGCTKEACAFRDNLPKFKASKAAVLGVSILDEASKAKFADKSLDLNFPLLADVDICCRREVWGVGEEVAVRPVLHGHRPNHVPHRRGRQGREAMGQCEGARTLGRGRVGGE